MYHIGAEMKWLPFLDDVSKCILYKILLNYFPDKDSIKQHQFK